MSCMKSIVYIGSIFKSSDIFFLSLFFGRGTKKKLCILLQNPSVQYKAVLIQAQAKIMLFICLWLFVRVDVCICVYVHVLNNMQYILFNFMFILNILCVSLICFNKIFPQNSFCNLVNPFGFFVLFFFFFIW